MRRDERLHAIESQLDSDHLFVDQNVDDCRWLISVIDMFENALVGIISTQRQGGRRSLKKVTKIAEEALKEPE